ncbi:hypothetical protein MIMGU_mgv1a018922mg [Erythranthe guttata]|uniref:NB-ARC domain-containing protein n=1 Tax=Erythranthe guttata TaxID=4155 RepID=A0A022QED2_ERYGU|nr:PREDICTED: putative disease resistance protein At1g50180 [Erythranthe guttata]EYU26321.1 hypothetical protein MIMGU_mgv1a018922mg [Erythranthe guttata]|eukprot:XP_012850613.1 PREDICTED: putative disease resistance protein At1g50180 [Erythranthe guttata]
MADVAILIAVGRINELLMKKATFLQEEGVEGQLRLLKGRLERMQSFQRDASDKESNDERIRNWISNIRDVAHDTEDVIDAFVLKIDIPRRRRTRLPLLGKCLAWIDLRNIGREIESIHARLDDISRSRVALGISSTTTTSSLLPDAVEWRRQLDYWQRDKHVVGVDGDTDKLLKEFILDESIRELSVATIVGMGGIGKSCLARHLYHHRRVADHFDCRLWVFVSTKFNPKQVIKELMAQVLDKPIFMDNETLPQLASRLRRCLEGKRYLIVLDDVWEDEHWEFLASLFPCEEKASRLLLTSRNRMATMNAPYIHEMKLLDPEKSWELLLNKAFVGEFKGKLRLGDFEIIGREILKKCRGMPLAIVTIGDLLIDRNPSTEKYGRKF